MIGETFAADNYKEEAKLPALRIAGGANQEIRKAAEPAETASWEGVVPYKEALRLIFMLSRFDKNTPKQTPIDIDSKPPINETISWSTSYADITMKPEDRSFAVSIRPNGTTPGAKKDYAEAISWATDDYAGYVKEDFLSEKPKLRIAKAS